MGGGFHATDIFHFLMEFHFSPQPTSIEAESKSNKEVFLSLILSVLETTKQITTSKLENPKKKIDLS